MRQLLEAWAHQSRIASRRIARKHPNLPRRSVLLELDYVRRVIRPSIFVLVKLEHFGFRFM